MRMRRRQSFPPYQLLDHDYLSETQAKFRRLENIYHVAQRKSWDGKEVLAELMEKHGGISLSPDKRDAIARIFAVILWGELAAWNVATDLALGIDDVEAKMAASSQAFDEARHFYVMRDYLMELGIEIPPLDNFTRVVLVELAQTKSLLKKLMGMQLLVENVALHLFKMMAEARVEPVLSELMPYFEMDEARHVGLGMHYLPQMLENVGRAELLQLQMFQIKILTLIFWSAYGQRDAFETLGVDPHRFFRLGLKKQSDLAGAIERQLGRSFTWTEDGKGSEAGLLAKAWRHLNDVSINTFFPKQGTSLGRAHRSGLRIADRFAHYTDRLLEVVVT
jgi:hypothetical protein